MSRVLGRFLSNMSAPLKLCLKQFQKLKHACFGSVHQLCFLLHFLYPYLFSILGQKFSVQKKKKYFNFGWWLILVFQITEACGLLVVFQMLMSRWQLNIGSSGFQGICSSQLFLWVPSTETLGQVSAPVFSCTSVILPDFSAVRTTLDIWSLRWLIVILRNIFAPVKTLPVS